MRKFSEIIFFMWVFLLPWQTRWIAKQGILNGAPWEYGTLSVYATELLLMLFLGINVLRSKKDDAQNNDRKIRGVLFLLLFSAWVSFFASGKIRSSLGAFIHLAEGILLCFALMRSKINVRTASTIFVIAMVMQAMFGISQFLTQQTFSSKWLGIASHEAGIAGASVVEAGSMRYIRAYGTMPHPNILAGYLVIALVLAAWLYQSSNNPKWKYIYSVSFVIMLTALFFTFSRAAWFALGIVGIVALYRRVRNGNRSLLKLVCAIFFYLIFLSILYWPLIATRVTAQGRLETQSTSERLASIKQAGILGSHHAFRGVGIGNYTLAVFNEVDSKQNGWSYQPVHNTFLLIFTELGIFGLFIFIALIYVMRASSPMLLIPILLLMFFDHFLWSLYPGVMLFWLVIGMGYKLKTDNQIQPLEQS